MQNKRKSIKISIPKQNKHTFDMRGCPIRGCKRRPPHNPPKNNKENNVG